MKAAPATLCAMCTSHGIRFRAAVTVRLRSPVAHLSPPTYAPRTPAHLRDGGAAIHDDRAGYVLAAAAGVQA